MSATPIWTIVAGVVSAGIIVLGIYAHHLINILADVTHPCQHDSVWTGTYCDCFNSMGVWTGDFCEKNNCSNRGKPIEEDGLWSCQCGTIRSDAGRLCDQCYTEDCSKREPSCNTTIWPTGSIVDGRRCNQVCLPDASSLVCNGLDLGLDGSCVGCNGHGRCGSAADCICERGWYDSPTGEQCAVTCEEQCGTNAYCLITGGEVACVCKPGFFNEPACDVSCPGIDPDTAEGISCSGHGACSYASKQQLGLPHFHPSDTPTRDFAICACEPVYTAVGSYACAYECPHRATVDLPCSGHGVCSMNENLDGVSCECVDGWAGPRCDCHPLYTCSGHGQCDDTDGTCICDAGPVSSSTNEPSVGFFKGGRCEQCEDNWFPEGQCTRFCDPNAAYDGSVHVFPHGSYPGFGCWGHGACTWNGEQVGCKCASNTDPDVFCSECVSAYYPKYNWVENIPDDTYCVVRCDDETCHSNGVCNPLYKPGQEPLCLCNVNERGMDTFNASNHCKTCEQGWYPDGQCERFCSSDLQLSAASGCDHQRTEYVTRGPLRVVEDITTRGKNKTRHARGPLLEKTITVDCLNCNPLASCAGDGTCICPEGVTGIECNIECESFQSDTCAGHGTCSQSPLVQWFDPESEVVRCDCEPEDPYEAEVRAYYERLGVTLDAPPTPHYFGKSCEYHCPTYNRNICAERGTCMPAPISPITACTRSNNACPDVSGVFCADVPTPWDDYALKTFQLPSYFQSPAPGAAMCRSKSCVDDLEQQDYEQVCVSLLSGLYPAALNGAACSSNGNECNQALIDAFTRGHARPPYHIDGRTVTFEDAWGENVVLVLVWNADGYFSAHNSSNVHLDECISLSIDRRVIQGQEYFIPGSSESSTCSLTDVVRVDVYHNTTWCQQSEIIFEEANVTSTCAGDLSFATRMAEVGCVRHDIRSECILDSACIFDTTVEYMRTLDERCFPLSPDDCDADSYCLYNDNLKTCDPRTFCRARTCADTLNDVGIAPLCIDLESCDGVEDPDHTCSILTERAVNKAAALHESVNTEEAPLTAEELYFYCWNYFQKDQPLKFTLPPPGDVALAHSDEYTKTAISVLRAKEADPGALVDGRFNDSISVTKEWCDTYENTRLPASSASAFQSKQAIHVQAPALIVCGNNTMMAFETDTGYASQLAQWYTTIMGVSCVVRLTSEPDSFTPQHQGLDAWRWSRPPVDIPYTWKTYCDALPSCPNTVSFSLRAPEYKSTPLDVYTFWSSSHVIGLFKDNAGTSIRDGWYTALDTPIIVAVTHNNNSVVESISQTSEAHVSWPYIGKESTDLLTPENKYITPVTICATELNYTAIPGPISYTWGTASPCPYETTVYANGTFVSAPYALQLTSGEVVYTTLNITSNTTALGMDSTRVDTSFQPDVTVSTFSPWNITVNIISGQPTFAFELVGSNEQEALRLDVFNGAVYFRGGSYITDVVSSLEVTWKEHQLYVNGHVQSYSFRYVPLEAHVYSTTSSADLRIYVQDYHMGGAGEYSTPTTVHFTERTRISLPASDASSYVMEGVLDGTLELPGIGAVQKHGNMRVEGSSEQVEEAIVLEVGDHNDAFSNPAATHNGLLTPVWTAGVYTFGQQVLFNELTYQVTETSTSSLPNSSSWTQLPKDAWPHGARLEIVPPIAVASISDATYVSDTLDSALYAAGNIQFGSSISTNVSGWLHTVHASVDGEQVWSLTGLRPTSTPPHIHVTGTLDTFEYTAAAYRSECYNASFSTIDSIAYETCGDQPCDWPFVDFLQQCERLRNASIPEELESFLGAPFIDWSAFCAYAHPPDYDWSGVHYGYIWHDTCNVSDIVCHDAEWVDTCFARTTPYASTCASTCIDTLRTRVNNSICERVNDLSNVTKLSGQACNGAACAIDFIPRQFCDTQNAYHDVAVDGLDVTHNVRLPFLSTTECSETCNAHLSSVLNWVQWEDTCAALGSGDRPGFCSTSSCNCDVGYDGNQCELQCPVGSADGEDATCSGENGFCIPSSTEAFVLDTAAQQEAGEYIPNDVEKTNEPLWVGGPDAVEGVCQCVQGSGEDCSINCDHSNNGTYGPGLRSQYGICDANLAAVKSLPPCTRYNADFLTESGLGVAYNSTTFDQALIVYPERFFFCNLSTIYDAVANSTEMLEGSDDVDPTNAWRVLTHVCWPWGDFSARRETRRKASQNPFYEPNHWYWNLESSLDLVSIWEEDVNVSFPLDRTPVFVTVPEHVFNVSGEVIGVAPGNAGAFEQVWGGYNQHVFVRDPPLNRYNASWAQYGDVILMYGGRLVVAQGDGPDTTELWRFDVSVGGVVTIDAHVVETQGPGVALNRPFAAADGVAYLWASDGLWELDLTGVWEWVQRFDIIEHTVQPSLQPVAVLSDTVFATDTCGIDLTAVYYECVDALKTNTTLVAWDPPTVSERACSMYKQNNSIYVDEYELMRVDQAWTSAEVYLHDLKTMNQFDETFTLRVRKAVRLNT